MMIYKLHEPCLVEADIKVDYTDNPKSLDNAIKFTAEEKHGGGDIHITTC